MSRILERMAEAHSARMAVHGAMLAHLGIDPGPEAAPSLAGELRATVLSCTGCPCPQTCSDWMETGHAGSPPWCNGAEAFATLTRAVARLPARDVA